MAPGELRHQVSRMARLGVRVGDGKCEGDFLHQGNIGEIVANTSVGEGGIIRRRQSLSSSATLSLVPWRTCCTPSSRQRTATILDFRPEITATSIPAEAT